MELWKSVEKEDRTVECNSPGLIKVRLQMGNTCGVTFVVGSDAPTETARRRSVGTSDKDKDLFSSALHEAIREAPGRDHVVVMMDANACTGKAQDRCKDEDANVMGAYGRIDMHGYSAVVTGKTSPQPAGAGSLYPQITGMVIEFRFIV